MFVRKKKRNVDRRNAARQRRSGRSWRRIGKTAKPKRQPRETNWRERGPAKSIKISRQQLEEIVMGKDKIKVKITFFLFLI